MNATESLDKLCNFLLNLKADIPADVNPYMENGDFRMVGNKVDMTITYHGDGYYYIHGDNSQHHIDTYVEGDMVDAIKWAVSRIY